MNIYYDNNINGCDFMIGKILMIALFILLGTMLSLGKWSFLIAGFNTMSKEEKENYISYKLKQYDKLCKVFEENVDTDKILEIIKTKKEEEEKSLED